MSKVICDLPNAGEVINGFKFTPHADGGLVSEKLPSEAFDLFLSIPGYRDAEPAPVPVAPEPVAPVVKAPPAITPAAAKAARAAAQAEEDAKAEAAAKEAADAKALEEAEAATKAGAEPADENTDGK